MTMTQTDTPRYRDRTTLNHRIPTIFFALLLLGNIACADANTGSNGNQETPGGSFNLGSTASASDIAAWDLDMDPSGSGAPIGSGSVSEGKQTYDLKCASCHGIDGGGTPLGDQLVGREPLEGFPFGQVRGQYRRTVGNYWPYATTLFDYIIRAMPMNSPRITYGRRSLCCFSLHSLYE